MKQEFYRIYEDLSQFFESTTSGFPYLRVLLRPRHLRVTRSPLTRLGARWVRESIDAAATDLGWIQLRPDAKHFLLINFYEMILLPLSHPDNPLPVREEEVRDAILHDVRAIVNKAGAQRQSEEITGSDILKATAELLDSLRISEFRFWGAKDHAE